MKKTRLMVIAVLVIIAVLTTGSIHAQGTLYQISFSGGGSSANGQITVVGGIATSGYLDITAGPNSGTYTLLPGGPSVQSPEMYDGTDLIYDNIVNVAANPFVDGDGLAFANGPISAQGTIGINLWGNGADSYTLFGDPTWGSPYATGNAQLTTTPEGGTLSLILLGLAGIGALRKTAIGARGAANAV